MASADYETTNRLLDASADDDSDLIIIEPTHGWRSLRLRELWQYRELLYYLTWRSIKVRYKQTIIGAGWAIIQPFTAMVVFSIFFGQLAQIPSDGIPYPIFSYTALVPWTFFANSLTETTTSIVRNSNLIKKIYFPRLTVPLSAVLSGLVDFALSFSVLLLMIAFFIVAVQQPLPPVSLKASIPEALEALNRFQSSTSALGFSANVIFLPFFVLLAMVTALGAGLWLAALNVRFRDIQYIVPFMIQIWLFVTPIVYPSSMVDAKWRLLLALNPMAGVVEGFRWALLNQQVYAPGPVILVSSVMALVLLISGAFYFQRMEKLFADIA